MFYQASGTTLDYIYNKTRIKYSYVPELRGPGFDPPPSEIERAFKQNWVGLVALLREISNIEERNFYLDRMVWVNYSNALVVLISYGIVGFMYLFLAVWLVCGIKHVQVRQEALYI